MMSESNNQRGCHRGKPKRDTAGRQRSGHDENDSCHDPHDENTRDEDPLTPSELNRRATAVRAQAAILTTLNVQITAMEEQVEAHFGQHPEAEILLIYRRGPLL